MPSEKTKHSKITQKWNYFTKILQFIKWSWAQISKTKLKATSYEPWCNKKRGGNGNISKILLHVLEKHNNARIIKYKIIKTKWKKIKMHLNLYDFRSKSQVGFQNTKKHLLNKTDGVDKKSFFVITKIIDYSQ